jgi:negative regulator of flagellin synthesis FlgM
MPTLAQPRLNRSFVLRYDHAHETVSVETSDSDADFDAQIDAVIAARNSGPASSGVTRFEQSAHPVDVSDDITNDNIKVHQNSDQESVIRNQSDGRGMGNDHMDVNGISGIGRTQAAGGIRPADQIDTPATSALAPQDEVQISAAAQSLDELSRTADVRMERIAQIQQEIAEGIYDSDEKLDAALDRFLDAYGLNDD